LTEFSSGHPGAFGLGIGADNIESFVETTDSLLADMESEAFHYVDYIFTNTDIDYETILSIGQMGDLWGQNVEQPKVAIDKLRITPDMVAVYAKKTNTVRITIPNNKTTLILFDAPEDLCQQLQNTQGYVIMNIVGEPALNEYNGFVSAQIKVKEYEVVGESRYSF
jgi:single-stranded DNA-specific DHH superfamily exonuclease